MLMFGIKVPSGAVLPVCWAVRVFSNGPRRCYNLFFQEIHQWSSVRDPIIFSFDAILQDLLDLAGGYLFPFVFCIDSEKKLFSRRSEWRLHIFAVCHTGNGRNIHVDYGGNVFKDHGFQLGFIPSWNNLSGIPWWPAWWYIKYPGWRIASIKLRAASASADKGGCIFHDLLAFFSACWIFPQHFDILPVRAQSGTFREFTMSSRMPSYSK